MKNKYLSFFFWAWCAAARLDGPVHLKDQHYDTLTIRGDAHLERVRVGHLVVHGQLVADHVVANYVQVNGPASADHMTAERMQVSGALKIRYSQVDQLFALSEVEIHGLKSKYVYLYGDVKTPLYGVQAEEIWSQHKDPTTITVGDACYITSILFKGAPGTVSVIKDRSFVGEVEGGRLSR